MYISYVSKKNLPVNTYKYCTIALAFYISHVFTPFVYSVMYERNSVNGFCLINIITPPPPLYFYTHKRTRVYIVYASTESGLRA